MFKPRTSTSLCKSPKVLAWLPDPTYFYALMQKSSKKNQGFRKMAKNYFVSLSPAKLAPGLHLSVSQSALESR